MKSNTKKRLIAFMLCMVLVLSSATSVFADEPQNTDSQSQTEAVTEPAADEATGDEAAVNSSEQQQQQEEQQPETESAPEGNLENDISIQTTINGTTITMSGPYSSFPEGSNYEILASELNEEETKNVEVALKKKEDEINTKIATYKAYDIKLLVDGIESQPTGNVNVKFEGGEVQENLETAENIEVYHVDETTQIANDIEKTAVDDTVTMTTNHFSTYVITTTKPEGVDITVQHYIKYTDSNNQPAEKALYRDSKIHLNENQVITDLSSLQNYTSQEVIKIDADGSKGEQISNNQVITADQTYRVYYTPTTATSNEDVQMFDYQVKGENNTSINAEKNYDQRSTKTTRFASGLANKQHSGTPYDIVMVLDTSGSMSDTFYKYTEYTGNLNSKESYYIKTDDKIYQKIKYSDGGWGEESYWYYKNTDETEVRVTQETNTIYTRAKDSTTNNKNAALKAAAKAFVENVNTKNPDSRIGIVTFASGSTINNSIGKTMLRVGDSKATIDKWIDDLGANGATNTAAGFKSAKNIFDNSSNWEDVRQNQNRKKLIVFLTDGVPTKSSDFNETVATSTVNTAITLKGASYNAEIYSLGIFDAANYTGSLGNKANIKKVSKFMKDVASDDSKYMTADSVQSLYDIFNSITDNMPVSITATITDVIDSRFELTTGEKERLEGRGATVSENDDGTTTVTWTNTTVKSKTGNTPGWHETIEIKAKDNFIGGNMIPTNGPASGITVGDNTKYFPQPSVNVKLLTPSIGDKEITYYKGDTIESSKFSRELLGTYKMTELDTTTAVEKGIPKLTEEQLTKLKNGETVEIPYSYTNSNTDIEGTFVYKYKNKKYEAEGTKVNPLENHPATKVGKDVEEYTLTVVFVPKTVDERKTLLNDTAVLEPNGNANISGTVVTNASVTGTYKVHVLALWAIVKQSTSTGSDGKHPMLSGAKFELVKDSKVCYTGESKSDGFVEWYKDETKVSLSEIEKATYTLRETSAPAGYAKNEVQWTIAITDTTVTITGANGKTLIPTQLENPTTGKTYDAYTYENTPVYALPSTGGTGIYLYMIGGMLLMFAAVWILYKNQCKEVLGK